MTDVEPAVAFLQAAHEEIEKSEHGKRTLVARPTCPSCGNNASEFSLDGSDSYDLRCGDTVTVASFWEHNGEATPDRSALARVQAEKAILASYEHADREYRRQDRGASPDYLSGQLAGAYGAVLDLAHGHRHTVPGWREGWTPEGAEA